MAKYEQSKFIKYVDVTKCDGCRACMVACKNWNDLPAEPEEFHGSIQSHEALTANTWNIITYDEHERADGGFDWLFRHDSCFHCTTAGCELACPEDAISHTEFGSVVIDPEACVGCGYCVQGCYFDVIQLATYKDNKGKEYRLAQKCDLCTSRLENGKQPACVTACHTDCLVYGDRETVLRNAEARLAKVKERYPNANIYNPAGIDGVATVYLLAEKPSVYGLPENPQAKLSQVIWKDYAQPIGKLMAGATTAGILTAMAVQGALKLKNRGKEGEIIMSKRKPKIQNGKVKRFSIHFMIFHWGYALSYFTLYLTGLAMYTNFFDWLYIFFGGPATGRLIHRIAAIAFVLFPIYMLIFDRKSMFHWLKNAFKWGKHDIQYLMNFPLDMFGFKTKNPPQDFISGGEKMNSLMQIFTFFMFVASGVVMWVPQYFPGWMIDWSYPMHNIALGLSFMVVIGHIYLSSKNPSSKASLEGMTTGYCSEDYAKHHHGNWYEEVKAEDEALAKEEEEKRNKGA